MSHPAGNPTTGVFFPVVHSKEKDYGYFGFWKLVNGQCPPGKVYKFLIQEFQITPHPATVVASPNLASLPEDWIEPRDLPFRLDADGAVLLPG